jgi:hypothetical protein
MSEVQLILLISLYKYGVNFTASMMIVFKLTIFNYHFVKLKQSKFERNAKMILGFEHFSTHFSMLCLSFIL